ncbi:MAG TPA: DUF2782 domain-containing protein [Burkholderiales bacterium]
MQRYDCLVFVLALLVPLGARAAEEVPPPPPPPAQDSPAAPAPPEESFEPEITITTRDGVTYEEYRYNGRLYRVKVTPRFGPPYYLIYDEHGNFHRSDAEPEILVPHWVIRRF